MIRFEYPFYLYLFSVIPLLVLLWIYYERSQNKKLSLIADKKLLRNLMPDFSKIMPRMKFFISLLILSFLIIVLARPQTGTKIANERRQGIEVMVALDISNSMLAEDVAPSRLEKSKMLIENMVDGLSDDKVGLVVFAGSSYVQLPITSDFVSAKMFLQSLSPTLIATQGTDIGSAIDLCLKSFPSQKSNNDRAIVLITDGEDHEGKALEMAGQSRKKGINVFVLGIGSSNGGLVPDGSGGYLKGPDGKEVLSVLNEEICKKIAKAGAGAYIHVDNTNKAQEQLDKELVKLQQGDLYSVVYSEYAEQFQFFALLGVLFIVFLIVLDISHPCWGKFKLFNS